jgi:hypothetical protein
MRRRRAAFVVLMLTLLSLLVAGPAHAGGPTSVLLVVPGAGQTASLYNADADYEVLAGLVGAFALDGTDGKVDRSGASHVAGSEVTVTWLIHDVQVWRVDQVYVGGHGGPWISTQQSTEGSQGISGSAPVWHTATNSARLIALLDRLGVNPGSAGSAVDSTGTRAGGDINANAAPQPATSPAAGSFKAGSTQGVSRTNDTGKRSSAELMWGLVGLASGVVITLAAVAVFASWRPLSDRRAAAERTDDGDAELLSAHDGDAELLSAHDGDAELLPAHGGDGEQTWSSTEELSWPAQRR